MPRQFVRFSFVFTTHIGRRSRIIATFPYNRLGFGGCHSRRSRHRRAGAADIAGDAPELVMEGHRSAYSPLLLSPAIGQRAGELCEGEIGRRGAVESSADTIRGETKASGANSRMR